MKKKAEYIMRGHYIANNDTHNFAGSTIITEPQSLDESEYLYNGIKENKMIFENFFIGAENLPEYLTVQKDSFFAFKNIKLEGKIGGTYKGLDSYHQ